MLELKFFKELPCRSLNNNKSFVELAGADLYNDKEGNRYAFLSFKNNYKGPFFSLYLYLKEYDSSGTFLKENKFSVPNFYGKTGLHVINEPIELEKECEGIEVYIYLAEYVGKNFYNDAFVTPGNEKLEMNLAAMKNQAKASTNSQSRPIEGAELSQEEQAPQYDENGEEIPVQAGPASAASMASSANAVVTTSKGLFNFIPLAAVVLAIVVGVILAMAVIPSFINGANNGFSGGGSGGNGGQGGGGGWDDWDFIRLFFINLFHK